MYCSSLTTASRLDVLSIFEACVRLRTEDDFKDILKKTSVLIGQEMTACGIGAGNVGSMKAISNINAGFPEDYLAAIVNSSGRVTSPLFRRWEESQLPQSLDFKDNPGFYNSNGIDPYLDFSLRNVISHGVLDCSQRYVTYFGFAQIPERIRSHHTNLIEILVPHLHVAYTKLISVRKSLLSTTDIISVNSGDMLSEEDTGCLYQVSNGTQILSAREHEVIRWLFDGKTNWDISRILNISEYTVKNHVQRIIKKLNATSRQHAVAKALEIGLIKL